MFKSPDQTISFRELDNPHPDKHAMRIGVIFVIPLYAELVVRVYEFDVKLGIEFDHLIITRKPLVSSPRP